MFRKQKSHFFSTSKGFTLIELLVVLTIIAILASIVLSNIHKAREAAYFVKAKQELRSIHESLELYKNDNGGDYPPDADRNIPPGLEQYLAPDIWPGGAWPGSVLDWDNWNEPGTGKKIYQISIRFCPVGEPENCRFPDENWAQNFDISSSVFYCIDGPCRAHIAKPPNHPGYCVNCLEPQYPYGIY